MTPTDGETPELPAAISVSFCGRKVDGLGEDENRLMDQRRERVPAAVIRAGEGETIEAAGVQHLFTLTHAQTGGRFALEEFVVPPSTMGARAHIHWAHDEYFYVVQGQLTVLTEIAESVLGPGDVAQAGRGAVHGYRNASIDTPARALCMYTPAGYEQYFRDVHAAAAVGTEVTVELLAELRGRFQTDSM